VVFEPEAAIVRRIFADYTTGGHSIRQIVRRLHADGVPPPTGQRPVWGTSTISRILHNEAYIGRVYFNRTEVVADHRPGRRTRQIPRPRDGWIPITVPSIVDEAMFDAVRHVTRDNSQWSPRRAEPGQWMLRGLVKCGTCGVGVNCHKMRGRNGTWHRYYYCRNHDPIKAGGPDKRCPERNIRADALDTFVFDQIRAALLRPDTLTNGEQAVAAHRPAPDDELLAAELARLDRRLHGIEAERRRLVDLYQTGLIDLPELQRRATATDTRRQDLQQRRDALTTQRQELARDNQIRNRVAGFAHRVLTIIDQLAFDQRQQLLRLVVDEVRVTGWNVTIQLRIPLDEPPNRPPHPKPDDQPPPTPMSTEDGLRSLGVDDVGVVQQPVDGGGGQRLGHQLVQGGGVQVGADGQAAPFVGGVDEAVEAFGGVRADRQQPDVIDGDEVGAHDAGDGLGDGVVGAVMPDEGAEVFDGEPGHGHAAVDGALAERLTEVALAGAGRPADAKVLVPANAFQCGQCVLGGLGDG
jgi:site-specific DNA recombinase